MSKNMKRAAVLAAGLLCASAGWAAEQKSGWQPFLVGGLTKGGDAIFGTVTIETGGTQHIYAGNLLQVGVGAIWTAKTAPFALGLSVNYHIDDTTGKSESAQFKRVPLEAIGYYLSEDRQWRAGLGLRYVTGAQLDANFPDNSSWKKMNVRFENAKGLVVETGWAFGDNVWLNLRVVKEEYQATSAVLDGVGEDVSGSEKINGSHVGVNLLYAF